MEPYDSPEGMLTSQGSTHPKSSAEIVYSTLCGTPSLVNSGRKTSVCSFTRGSIWTSLRVFRESFD